MFDLLGSVLDRASTFAIDHWIVLAVIVAAVLWRRPLLAERPAPDTRVSIGIIVVVSLAMSIGYAWMHGTPVPQYHDDFAYMLDADTFAHGRMSNPTHPMWPHFETMHVLQMPRYISKYPIGHGLVFAAGTVLLGHPLRAMWIAGIAMCLSVWWALRALTTPWLALFGALATAIHPTTLEWMESYHGGALAAIGGALLLGAAARNKTFGAIAASGVLLLAISRPYEGVIFCIAVGILFVRRATVAGIAVLLAGLALLAVHNRSITGSPFVLPYSVYEKQYDPAPNFLWEEARPMPRYRNREMEFVYRATYLSQYKRVHAPGGIVDETLKKIDVIDRAVFGTSKLANPRPLFLLLLVPLIPLVRRDRIARMMAIALAIFAFAPFSIIWWLQLHYLAPATAIAAGLVILLLRRLFVWNQVAGTAVAVLFVANSIVAFVAGFPPAVMEQKRIGIAHLLLAQGGKHLIMVAPEVFDAVYNGADLDHAPIVWARDLGPQSNAQLIAYYRDRTIWWLSPSGLRRY